MYRNRSTCPICHCRLSKYEPICCKDGYYCQLCENKIADIFGTLFLPKIASMNDCCCEGTLDRHFETDDSLIRKANHLANYLSYVNGENETDLKDSGARREFETGAVRDISEGKGRCDLLPLDIIDALIHSDSSVQDSNVLYYIERFKITKQPERLENALFAFRNRTGIDFYTMMLEVSKHYENGAKKYSENNWMKGIPLHCYIDSAVRHYLKHERGDTDEPHDRAVIWNILGALWTFKVRPELDDISLPL